MRKANPAFIPRNHLVEIALSAAVERQDFQPFEVLLDVVSPPTGNGRDWSGMLRPQVPGKVFGGRSVGRNPRDELWAPVLRLVLYVVFGKASLMGSVPVVAHIRRWMR